MENLIFTKENKIGILTFNRPETKNSLDARTYDELFEIIPQIDKDEDINVLIITGAGDSFCAGFQAHFNTEETSWQVSEEPRPRRTF